METLPRLLRARGSPGRRGRAGEARPPLGDLRAACPGSRRTAVYARPTLEGQQAPVPPRFNPPRAPPPCPRVRLRSWRWRANRSPEPVDGVAQTGRVTPRTYREPAATRGDMRWSRPGRGMP